LKNKEIWYFVASPPIVAKLHPELGELLYGEGFPTFRKARMGLIRELQRQMQANRTELNRLMEAVSEAAYLEEPPSPGGAS
jgi:hypothetical protein